MPTAGQPILVCYVLCYRAPDYVRTRSLLTALRKIPGVRVVVAANKRCGIWRYVESWRALCRVRDAGEPDVYIIGFRGHEIFPWVRRLACGAPLVFDALMSPAAALVEEGKGGAFGRLLAPIVHALERYALLHSDVVLTDTGLQRNRFIKAYGLAPGKVVAVPVGAVEAEPGQLARRARVEQSSDFTVLFYGSFLPLHGIDIVIEAAARLRDLPIRFDFIGGRAAQARRLRRACSRLGVTSYAYRRWVPFQQLITDEIPSADVCLGGPFGGTPQARCVVTGKASQCLALGRPTVIGRIDEDYGFRDRVNCFLVKQRDPEALAACLRWAYLHPSDLAEIGRRGRALYDANLSVEVVANVLSRVMGMLYGRCLRAAP